MLFGIEVFSALNGAENTTVIDNPSFGVARGSPAGERFARRKGISNLQIFSFSVNIISPFVDVGSWNPRTLMPQNLRDFDRGVLYSMEVTEKTQTS